MLWLWGNGMDGACEVSPPDRVVVTRLLSHVRLFVTP